MNPLLDSLAAWATIVGTILALLGVFQSRAWLLAAGAVVATVSLVALGYANKQRAVLRSAERKIAGRSLDSLNLASLRRHMSRTLVIQEARNVAVIDGEDITITWDCLGYCRSAETSIEFSVDADANIPFEELDCIAFDLIHDPGKRHAIRPILVGADGLSKKIAVPFLSPLRAQDPFRVLLKCSLAGCMKSGIDYYTATLSFEQDRIQRYMLHLSFLQDAPKWLRVYESHSGGSLSLLKDLRPVRKAGFRCEYRDLGEDVPARSVRVYVFSRPGPLRHHATLEKPVEAGVLQAME